MRSNPDAVASAGFGYDDEDFVGAGLDGPAVNASDWLNSAGRGCGVANGAS